MSTINRLSSPDNDHLALALRCQARLAGGRSLHEALVAFANTLLLDAGARSVHVGLVEQGRIVEVLSSHDDASTRDAADEWLVAALEEALDQGVTLSYPPQAEHQIYIHRAQQALSRHLGHAVVSIPMFADEVVVGVLVFVWPDAATIDAAKIERLENVLSLAAPVVALKVAAEWPLRRRLRQSLVNFWREDAGRRRLLLGAAALTVVALALPLPDEVIAEARIEGRIQRTLVAPADGFVDKAFVRPGDRIRKDQELVRLSDRELQLEAYKLENELSRHMSAFSGAQSGGDRGQMVAAAAKVEETKARLVLAQDVLERSVIRAPLDGVVLSGDLEQSQGKPVSKGDELLVVAPSSGYRLALEVDERDVARLKNGGEGRVALSGSPRQALPFTVARIMPMTTEHEGRHFIPVEGALASSPPEVQPGMHGIARIDAGYSPLLFQLTARFRHWLAFRAWSLFGL